MQVLVLISSVVSLCHAVSLYDKLTEVNATMFKSLIDQAGLASILQGSDEYTVLVPTDAAIAKIPQQDLDNLKNNPAELSNILKYHILSGMHVKNDFLFGRHYFLNSTNNHVIRVYRTASGTHFNQATAVQTNIFADNGVIHLINSPLEVPEGTIVDILGNQQYNLTKFLDLIKSVGLDRNYANPTGINRYTVFAPTNDPVDVFTQTHIDALNQDATNLQLLIEYHVHSGTMHASTLAKRDMVTTTLPDHSITVSTDATGNILLDNKAYVSLTDIEAENGVVHIISEVLTPLILQPVIG